MLIQPPDYRCRSILVRHHYGDGGLRVVDVEGAASGNEFHLAWCAIVVSDMKRYDPGQFATTDWTRTNRGHGQVADWTRTYLRTGHERGLRAATDKLRSWSQTGCGLGLTADADADWTRPRPVGRTMARRFCA